jgi:hypothetical protein
LSKSRIFLFIIFAVILLGICCSGPDSNQTKSESTTLNVLWSGDERFLGPEADDSPKLLMFLTLAKFRNQEGEVIGR